MSIVETLKKIESVKAKKVILSYFRGALSLEDTKHQINCLYDHYLLSDTDLMYIDMLLP